MAHTNLRWRKRGYLDHNRRQRGRHNAFDMSAASRAVSALRIHRAKSADN
jgi:hypothetical protein